MPSRRFWRGLAAALCLALLPALFVPALRGELLLLSAGLLLGGLGLALALARRVGRPVEELSIAAGRLASGEYGARVRRLPGDALGRLGEAFNLMAGGVQAAVLELSRDRARLGAILDNMVEGVLAVDADGGVLALNPALRRLFSIQEERVEGKPFLELLRHSQLSELLQATLREGTGRSAEIQVFAPEERCFEAHAAPLPQEGGGRGALLVLHDITRLRKLEQMRRDLVANVSHELRTPLASIKGFAETLRLGALEDKKHRLEFVENIERDADRLSRLVDDLLDLSALESGQRRPALEPVLCLELARDAADSLRPLARRREVSLEVQEQGGLPSVAGDRAQLRQVFLNLLDNAVKFNRPGGSVRVRAEASGGWLTLAVEDTGRGIPPEDLPRVFERFYRVDKARSREQGGTGLGLAIAKHILEAHGGSVSVESEPGRGSTFRVRLPVQV